MPQMDEKMEDGCFLMHCGCTTDATRKATLAAYQCPDKDARTDLMATFL
jgi:hypothetical protein